jgi:hypothetical protein
MAGLKKDSNLLDQGELAASKLAAGSKGRAATCGARLATCIEPIAYTGNGRVL